MRQKMACYRHPSECVTSTLYTPVENLDLILIVRLKMTSYLRRFRRDPFWYACFFDANGRMSQVSNILTSPTADSGYTSILIAPPGNADYLSSVTTRHLRGREFPRSIGHCSKRKAPEFLLGCSTELAC